MTYKLEKSFVENYQNKNLLINGDFEIWQRGTSFTQLTFNNTGGWTADRWRFQDGLDVNTLPNNVVGYRQILNNNDKQLLGNSRNYLTIYSNGTPQALYVRQSVETNKQLFAGKTLTFSVWLRSSGGSQINLRIQQIGSITNINDIISYTSPTYITTNQWQKYTFTATMSNYTGFIDNTLQLRANVELGNHSGDIDIAQTQLEFGNTATEFEYVPHYITQKMCYRYFQDYKNVEFAIQKFQNIGGEYGTGVKECFFNFLRMRTQPTIAIYSQPGLTKGQIAKNNDPNNLLSYTINPQTHYDELRITHNTTALANIGDYAKFGLTLEAEIP